jgi:uncharacterized membrane protein (DUF106 family)
VVSSVAQQALEVFIIGVVAVVIQNLLFKKLSDQTVLRELKKQLESAQAKMKEAQKSKDTEKLEKALNQVNALSMKRLSMTMKPNLISSVIFIVLLGWAQKVYANLQVPTPIPLPILVWKFPPVELVSSLSWFWWYFYIAIVVSIVAREVMGIEI